MDSNMTQSDERGQGKCSSELQFPALMQLGISADQLEALRNAGYLDRDRRRNQQVYWRLRFRQEGRQHTVYIGIDDAFADRVQRELQTLQAERRREHQLAHIVRHSKKQLRVLKTQLAALVAGIGFHYHGDQLRKRRTAS
jgi:hypothetical protein